MYSDDEVIRLAEIGARYVGPRFRVDWRELLGEAWQAAAQAAAKGRPQAVVVTAAVRGALRTVYYLRGSRRSGVVRKLTVQFVPDVRVRALPDTPTPTLEEVWADGEDVWMNWPQRTREWVYAYAVEGWDMKEIAAFSGVTRQTVGAAFEKAAKESGLDLPHHTARITASRRRKAVAA